MVAQPPRRVTMSGLLLVLAAFALLLAVVVALGAHIWRDAVWLPLGALLWVCSILAP